MKVLGMTTDITTCSCCGREDLKKTIALETEAGIVYAGSECVKKYTGWSSEQLKYEMLPQSEKDFKKEYEETTAALRVKFRELDARRDNCRPNEARPLLDQMIEVSREIKAIKNRLKKKYSAIKNPAN